MGTELSSPSALEIFEYVVRERVEERARQVSQALSKPERARFVAATGDRPNLGYRPVPTAQDDPVTSL